MNRKILIVICAGLILTLIVGVVVFKAFGSGDSIAIDGCDPFNVVISKGEQENSVNIAWNTKKVCSAYVLYGDDMKDLSFVAVDVQSSIQEKNHSVTINSLLSSKVYYFSIVSENTNYGKNGLPISFTIDSL